MKQTLFYLPRICFCDNLLPYFLMRLNMLLNRREKYPINLGPKCFLNYHPQKINRSHLFRDEISLGNNNENHRSRRTRHSSHQKTSVATNHTGRRSSIRIVVNRQMTPKDDQTTAEMSSMSRRKPSVDVEPCLR